MKLIQATLRAEGMGTYRLLFDERPTREKLVETVCAVFSAPRDGYLRKLLLETVNGTRHFEELFEEVEVYTIHTAGALKI